MAYKLAPMTPLKGTFMITSIVGFIISVIWAYPRWNDYGFAFAVVFAAMFIASLLSMTYSETGGELQIDPRRVGSGPVKKAVKKQTVRKRPVKKRKSKRPVKKKAVKVIKKKTGKRRKR